MNGRRVVRQRRRSTDKQDAILAAAAELAEILGYRRCTIEGVAKRAGTGKQTIYRWWPSKAALYVEVYQKLVSRRAVGVESNDPRDALLLTLCAVFNLLTSTAAGAILAGLIADATHDAAARDAVRGELMLGRRDLILGPLSRAPMRAASDAAAMADVVVALIWKNLILEPDSLNDALAEKIVDFAMGPADGGT